MSVMVLRQKLKEGKWAEAEEAVRGLFATLDRLRPEGLRYASTRLVGAEDTVVVLVELREGIEDPRPGLPEFQRFAERLRDWVDGPPVVEHLDVVGSYRLFGD